MDGEQNWEYKSDAKKESGYIEHKQPFSNNESELIATWTASEYVGHEKNVSWYAMLIGAGVAIAVVVYLLSGGDIFSTVAVLVVAVVLAVFAGRKPATLHYEIDTHGIHIDQKSYPFESFQSFSIQDEGAMHSLLLMPQKRFMPSLTLYIDEAQTDTIIDLLASYLPLEQHNEDRVERLLRKIRF